ncbi:site-2 protease family protein [Streptomyces antibioticus]|uniref:site-2 protease family protein n=1 Tax=Streptomyces antibioticus TaxID=1890 RepID=UPI0033B84D33
MVESGANERPRPDNTNPAEPPRSPLPDNTPTPPEPTTKPAAEPTAGTPTELAPETHAEPTTGPPAGPAAEPPADPVARPSAEPAATPSGPSAEPAAGTPAGPASEPPADPAGRPAAEPSAGAASETPVEPAAGQRAEDPAGTPVTPPAEPPAEAAAVPWAATPATHPAEAPDEPSGKTPAAPSSGARDVPPHGSRSEATADQHPHGPDTPDPTNHPAAMPSAGTEHRAHADTHDAPHDQSGGRRGRGKGRPPRRPPEQPRGGLLMGRPFGVPVYVAPSWFLVAALITWVFGGQLDRVLPELGAARYLVSLFFAVAFYASVLIHELAHTVAALRFKLPVRRIQLQFFGGVSEIEKEAETPGREFWLAFVGPLLSLALAGVFYLAMQPVEPGTVPGVLLAGLMISNLIVAIFNLLPGLPLDGGRMLRAVVWKITGKPMSGTVAAAWVGRALAVSVLIGLPLLTQSGALGAGAEDSVGMDTVTDALLAAILAAIIWTGAGNSLRMARLREHLPELRARTLTRRAVPVETHTPLSEALRRANDAGARALVVVDAHGEPLSLVREAAIVGVPEHRRPWVAVSGLAQDLTDGMRVSAELAGEDLLDVLRATPATEYLVVEETGEIYGVLSAADVERAFVKAMARPN